MARTFREIRAQQPAPKGKDVMWLRPTDGGFNILAWKPETEEWAPMESVTKWGDIEGAPGPLADEASLGEYVRGIVSGAGIADEVGFSYGGSAEAIASLPRTLTRTVGGEEVALPSVDAALEAIIAKVWYEPMTLSLTGAAGGAVKVGDAIPAFKASCSASSAPADAELTLRAWGEVKVRTGEASFTYNVPGLAASERKAYTVQLTATGTDSDGKPQSVAPKSITWSAWWPALYWRTASYSEPSSIPAGASALLLSKTSGLGKVFDFDATAGYYVALPKGVELTDFGQMQGMNDWGQHATKVAATWRNGDVSKEYVIWCWDQKFTAGTTAQEVRLHGINTTL